MYVGHKTVHAASSPGRAHAMYTTEFRIETEDRKHLEKNKIFSAMFITSTHFNYVCSRQHFRTLWDNFSIFFPI